MNLYKFAMCSLASHDISHTLNMRIFQNNSLSLSLSLSLSGWRIKLSEKKEKHIAKNGCV
jgi:hypothetical protein